MLIDSFKDKSMTVGERSDFEEIKDEGLKTVRIAKSR